MASGVAPGERVAVWAPNSAEWMLAALGALRAGAVLVPLNTRFKGAEAAYILRASGAYHAGHCAGLPRGGLPVTAATARTSAPLARDRVTARRGNAPARRREWRCWPWRRSSMRPAGSTLRLTEARAAALGPDDLSDIIFTSGTTGAPKGAATTHGQSLRTFGTWASIVGLQAGDRYLVVNPFFHTFGYKAGILASLMAGATVVPEAVFDAKRVMERIEDERISVLPGPPTLYQIAAGRAGSGGLRPVVIAPRRHRGRRGPGRVGAGHERPSSVSLPCSPHTGSPSRAAR